MNLEEECKSEKLEKIQGSFREENMSIVDFFKNRKANKIDKKLDVEDELPIIPMEIMDTETNENTAQRFVLKDICFYKGQKLDNDEYIVIPFIYNKDNSKMKDLIFGDIYSTPKRLQGYQGIDRRLEIAQEVLINNFSLRNVEEVDVASITTFQKSERLDHIRDRRMDNVWKKEMATTFVTHSDIFVITGELKDSYDKEWQAEKAERERQEEFARVSEATRDF